MSDIIRGMIWIFLFVICMGSIVAVIFFEKEITALVAGVILVMVVVLIVSTVIYIHFDAVAYQKQREEENPEKRS